MEMRETKKNTVTQKLQNGQNVNIVRKVAEVEYPATRTTSKVILGGVIKRVKISEDGASFSILFYSLPYVDPDLGCEIGGEDLWINFNNKFDAAKYARQLTTANKMLNRTVTVKATKTVDVCSDENKTVYTSYYGSDIKSGIRTCQPSIGAPYDGIFLNGKLSVTEYNGEQKVSVLVGQHKIPGTEQYSFHWINIIPPADFNAAEWGKILDANGKERLRNALITVDVASWKPVITKIPGTNGQTYDVVTSGTATALAIYSGEMASVESTSTQAATGTDGFMNIPDNADDEGLPFN